MKTCILFGSPRSNGNTASLLSVVTSELESCGHELIKIDAYSMNVGGCRACLGCQNDTEQICCVIQDDMQDVMKSVSECDLILVAAPVYIWSIPAPVKAILDRLVYSGCKYYGKDPHGPSLFHGKKLALVTTCGYPVEKGADLLNEAMRRYCKHTQMSYMGMLCERQRNLKESFMDEEKAEHAKLFCQRILSE